MINFENLFENRFSVGVESELNALRGYCDKIKIKIFDFKAKCSINREKFRRFLFLLLRDLLEIYINF